MTNIKNSTQQNDPVAPPKKLIVVLGMHRSGTSAIARALSALGIDLGDHLMPGVPNNNEKGFFEDLDINAFNTSLLEKLESTWDDLRPIDASVLLGAQFTAEKIQALRLLDQKFSSKNVFGFKDPKTSLLLPFWNNIFLERTYEVYYVLALRNPISVAKSLIRRDGMEELKALLLWAKYVMTGLTQCVHAKTLVIDYDQLFVDTKTKLLGIAQYLNLETSSVTHQAIERYQTEFLTTELRHNVATLDAVISSTYVPNIVKKIYAHLNTAATNNQLLATQELHTLMQDLKSLDPILCAHQVLEDAKNKLFWRCHELEHRLIQKDLNIHAKDLEIQRLQQKESNLSEMLSAQENATAHLNNALNTANDSLATTTHQLHRTCHEVEQLQYQNSQQKAFIHSLLHSWSWMLTKPLRFLRRNLLSKPLVFLKKAIISTLLKVWRTLPITRKIRLQFKELLFTKAPQLFRWSQIYAQWEISKQEHQLLTEQAKARMQSSPKYQPEHIPRISFDVTEEGFIPQQENKKIDPLVKVIAFYLPQFHPFPENDQWWGKGFTEWSNVGKAQPNYVGHYQPHLPIHLGYYDLRVPEVMEEQARLAKSYGIYGFNFYFYWFAGKILMESPLEAMLLNKKVDIPFCLTWANENWTRRWDGQEQDVLIAQNHSLEDSLNFIEHILKYFKDERYIRIDGKPVLMVYRANIIPNIRKIAKLWRKEVQKHGITDLYLMCAQTFGIRDPHEFGFDAAAQFPPHTVQSTDIRAELELTNPNFNGYLFSYNQVVEHALRQEEPNYKLFRAAMLSWDNTARKHNDANIFHGFSLLRYKQWLSALCNLVYSSPKYSLDEKIVFVNAWNEWAEGAHLEPDRKYGYGYLQTTYDVLANYDAQYQANQNVRRLARP